VWGGQNIPSQMPTAASRLYASNVATLLALMVEDGRVTIDFDDEIVDGACVTHDGVVRFEPARTALEERGD